MPQTVPLRAPDAVLLGAPCRPRILVVVDGLSYEPGDAFGIARYLEAMTAGMNPKPVFTLVDRYAAETSRVTIGADVYSVTSNFNFATAAPAMALASYDQIWLFGIDSSAFYLADAEVSAIATVVPRIRQMRAS